MIDQSGEKDPPGVDNPYWRRVRVIPGDPLDMKYDNQWSPVQNSLQGMISTGFRPDFRTDYGQALRWREELVRQYAWAVPNPSAVDFVYEHGHGGIVEIGAGTGYWAWQLSQRGLSVVAYDKAPPDQMPNFYHNNDDDGNPIRRPKDWTPRRTYHPVIKGGVEQTAVHPDRTLFLCWPPYDDPMAADALTAYVGNRLIYIGEGEGGCTADETFHKMLELEWTEVAHSRIVRWWGIRDWITVYARGAE
jgi:hypothetical protein